MQSPALPSFCRSRCTCMSTVRVWISGCACQTASSSWARLCTLPSRSMSVRSSLNSVAVSSTSWASTVTRCALRSNAIGPAVTRPPAATAGAASRRSNALALRNFQRTMYVLLALLAVQQPAPPSASPVSDTAHVVIVATTDVHGRVLGWDYVPDAPAPGGLSRAATMVEALRAQYPEQVVLVDAGDLIEGNVFAAYFAERDSQRPHPVVDALNAMQYDAATPGNHEFDFGPAVLARATGDATYHYVSANVFRGASDTLAYPPYVVVTRAGVKIGITGLTTPGVMVWDRSELGGRIRVRPIAEAAPLALRRLDLAGADLKVVLVHSGLNEQSSYDTAGVGAENAALGLASIPLPAPRPDLVIVGHSHKEMRDYVVNGVHFVQPRNFALSLAVVHVSLAKETTGYRVVAMRSELIPLATVAELPRFVRRFTAAHERARAWGAMPLGSAGPGFSARYGRAEDTPLLDFINEVQRRRAGADVSAAADFDLGAGLPEGEVRERDVSGIYPYENTLRAVRISGDQLKTYLEQAARYFRTYQPGAPLINDSVAGFNFDVVSGVTYTIDLTQGPGRRIRGLAFRGRAVTAADSFTLALSSYRQSGGGGYTMLRGARVVYDRGESIRDLLADEIRTRRLLTAQGVYSPSWSLGPAEARAALPARPGATAPGSDGGLALGVGGRAGGRVLPQAGAAGDYVIVVAHVGAFCAGDGAAAPLGPAACHGEIIDVARGLDSGSVDLIVSGHTHSLVNTVVNGIPIVQARSSGAGIAVVDFVRVSGAGGVRREVRARIETPFADRIRLNPALVDALRLSQASVSVITDRPVARFGTELRRTGAEHGLGRLIADAQRNIAKADVALVNNGGIRADVAAGLATYGDLYRVEPFQNRLLRLTVSGKVLKQALEHALSGEGPDAHVAGIVVWYDLGKPAGRRIKRLRLANGKDVDDGRTYTLAVSDFLAAGGSGYTMLVGAPPSEVGVTDVDALIQYLAVLRQPISAPDDPRFYREGGGR